MDKKECEAAHGDHSVNGYCPSMRSLQKCKQRNVYSLRILRDSTRAFLGLLSFICVKYFQVNIEIYVVRVSSDHQRIIAELVIMVWQFLVFLIYCWIVDGVYSGGDNAIRVFYGKGSLYILSE
ncbi:hypothetical protein SUGI_0177550 [Cryptomeria japonica]|nr:hypothetical protein SUGI_0177550 [Cryptomeria japonica]